MIEAKIGREALGVFSDDKANIAAVITDIVMPDRGGPDFIAKSNAWL